jgi:hypothetical protein
LIEFDFWPADGEFKIVGDSLLPDSPWGSRFPTQHSLVAHSVDLSVWQEVQGFGILYLSVIAGVMNLKVCELTKDPGTPSVSILGM